LFETKLGESTEAMENKLSLEVARPARLELATLCLEGRRSIQLSYGRVASSDSKTGAASQHAFLTESKCAAAQLGRE
jgi:hypothetical protein